MKERKVIGYGRVSTDKQDISKEVQQSKIQQYGNVYDYGEIDFFSDCESGKSFNRKDIQKCIELIKSNQVSIFIVYKLDRLGRNVVEINQFIDLCNKHNVDFVSIMESLNTKSAVGRMFINVTATFAQYEREVISERTSAALQQKKANGKRYSNNAPFGKMYDADNNMVDCEKEIKDLEWMRCLRKDDYTFEQIADMMKAKQVLNRSGKPYGRSFIGRLLKGE